MYYASAFKFTEMNPSFLCGISQCFCPGKEVGQRLQKERQIGKVPFLFNYYSQTPRTSFNNGQYMETLPPENTLIMGFWLVSRRELALCLRLGSGSKAFNQPDSERECPGGGTQCNYHRQEELQQCWSWAPGCSQTSNSFCATFMLTPSYRSSRRKKKQNITFSFLIINIQQGKCHLLSDFSLTT